MILENETLIELIVGAVAVLWAFFRTTEWFGELMTRARGKRCRIVIEALTAAVNETYDDYVRGLKASNAKKLSEDEREVAMAKTLRTAEALCKDRGVVLNSGLGIEYVRAEVEKLIREAKGGTG